MFARGQDITASGTAITADDIMYLSIVFGMVNESELLLLLLLSLFVGGDCSIKLLQSIVLDISLARITMQCREVELLSSSSS